MSHQPWALLLVVLGGALGAAARFSLDAVVTARADRGSPTRVHRIWAVMPPGTLVVNLVGCLLLGLLTGSAPAGVAPLWLVASGTGFCGSLTTFSTAIMEAARRVRAGRWGAAALVVAVHLIGSTAAVLLGLAVALAW